jgi:gamma-glutamyltranspeptidase/glutathione hydrolase
LDILAQGGNAFDAATAVTSVLAVVEPYHTSIGGGGFWLLHQEKEHKNTFVDGREVAPLAATKNMYLDATGHTIPGLTLNGGLAAAIPGEVAALVYIADHYGRLPLKQSLAAAIKLADEGFNIDQRFHFYSTMGDRFEWLQKFSATSAIFLKNGQPYVLGELLVQKDLAKTLRLIAEKGADGFYKGEVAQRLVDSINEAGGIWTLEDLARYQVKIREPLVAAYHHMLVVTAPLPSAGGISLITMLHILSRVPLDTFPKVKWVHYVIESMRLAYWQRVDYLGDPDYVSVPLDKLISTDNAKGLASLISPEKALDSHELSGHQEKQHQQNTTHFSIIDADGNRVSATLTVNYIFGSSVVAAGTGVLINNEMDDFSTSANEFNVFGLEGGLANEIAPGKRPVSSMAPTFLETPGRVAILGTPGGSRIPSMVLLSSLLFQEGYGAISMVSGMRFHHQYLPDVVQFEPDALTLAVQDGLKKMGYKLMSLSQYYGNMQAITWDKKKSILTASSDPRGIGLAEVVSTNQVGYGVDY